MRLLSPVFSKELATLSRRKFYFAARGLLLAALLAVVSVVWFFQSSRWTAEGFLDTAQLGHSLFEMFVLTQFFAVVILVPAFTASVVAAEKDRNTLGLLLMSNLSAGNILLDKLLSRLLVIVLLLASAVPLFLALLAFGGVTSADVFMACGDTLAAVLFCAGVGLLWSILLNKVHTALIATYASLLICFFGVVGLADRFDFNPEWVLPTPGGNMYFTSWAVCALVFMLCWAVSRRLLPHVAEPQKRQFVKKIFRGLDTFYRRINYTGVVLWEESRSPARNALFWKESHQRFFASNKFLIRATYLLVAVSLLVAVVTRDIYLCVHATMGGGTILCILIVIVASATAFTSERESRSLEVLLSTPVTARSLVLSKFFGTLRLTLPLLLCMALWFVLAVFVGVFVGFRHYYYYENDFWSSSASYSHSSFAYLLLLATVHLPLLTATGLYASARFRRTATALTVTFAVVFIWFLWQARVAFSLWTYEFESSPLCSYIELGLVLISVPTFFVLWIVKRRETSSWSAAVVLTSAWIIYVMFGFLTDSLSLDFLSAILNTIAFVPFLFRPVYGSYHLSLWSIPIVVGLWVFLLWRLIRRFDRMMGRQ